MTAELLQIIVVHKTIMNSIAFVATTQGFKLVLRTPFLLADSPPHLKIDTIHSETWILETWGKKVFVAGFKSMTTSGMVIGF